MHTWAGKVEEGEGSRPVEHSLYSRQAPPNPCSEQTWPHMTSILADLRAPGRSRLRTYNNIW